MVPIEYSLILGRFVSDNKDDQIASIDQILNGKYDEIIEKYRDFVKESSNNTSLAPKDDLERLTLAVALLNGFCQVGWTGPMLNSSIDLQTKPYIKELTSDGEFAYSLTPAPLLLIKSLQLLEMPSSLPSSKWWQMRAIFIHQRLLDNPSASLYADLLNLLETIRLPEGQDENVKELHARFQVEKGLILSFHHQEQQAVTCFHKAAEISNLQWQMTGALGKRTKYQSRSVAQLVVQAQSDTVTESSGTRQKDIQLEDDLLLEKIQLENSNQTNLKPLDQTILLSFCLYVKKTSPVDGLTKEEMASFVNRVLENANNWMIHTQALLLRSRLESDKARTVERSALQLQALVDQYSVTDSTVQERMLFFYSLMLPSKWEMEKELAERFVSIGVVASALEIFTRLEMWEQAIECLKSMDKRARAEKLVRDRLDQEPDNPVMWCLLGDLLQDPAAYERAWTVSHGRHARAMRSLGAHFFKLNDDFQCIACYRKALAVNPLFPNSWFVMGCSAARMQDWDTATEAFTRVVSLEDDNSEAWNNLASIYIRQKKKTEAFNALQQALKHNYDSWKMWQNYMYTATDLGDFSEALKAIERVVELRGHKDGVDCLDLEVLEILSNSIRQGTNTFDGRKATFLTERMDFVLDGITQKISSSPEVWTMVGKFSEHTKNYKKAIDAYQRAYRALSSNNDANHSEPAFVKLAQVTITLVNALETLGPLQDPPMKDWQYQAKMALKSITGRTKASWEDHEEWISLKTKLDNL